MGGKGKVCQTGDIQFDFCKMVRGKPIFSAGLQNYTCCGVKKTLVKPIYIRPIVGATHVTPFIAHLV